MQLPVLNDEDFISDKEKIATALMNYFIAVDKNQSSLWSNEIVSLKYIKFEHADNLDSMQIAVKEGIEKLYGNYFKEVTGFCDIIEEPDIQMNLGVVAKDSDGNQYTVDKSIVLDIKNK